MGTFQSIFICSSIQLGIFQSINLESSLSLNPNPIICQLLPLNLLQTYIFLSNSSSGLYHLLLDNCCKQLTGFPASGLILLKYVYTIAKNQYKIFAFTLFFPLKPFNSYLYQVKTPSLKFLSYHNYPLHPLAFSVLHLFYHSKIRSTPFPAPCSSFTGERIFLLHFYRLWGIFLFILQDSVQDRT